MLPRDLLVTRKRKGKIYPKYLKDIELAKIILDLFKKYQGKKYGLLLEELEEIEGMDFKIFRGLKTIVERQCRFKPSSSLPSKNIRFYLFRRGFVKTVEERKKLLEEAAREFNVTPKEIEDAIFSDLEEEQILDSIPDITAEELVRQYNLSITQTLLFDALSLSFKIDENYQPVFRQIKYLGLMYDITGENIEVTGPASLFKKNRRYGTSFAKLIPYIINAKEWEIQAKIETTVGREPKVLEFYLSSNTDIPLPRHVDYSARFDSEVEHRFYKDFLAVNSGWIIKREPDFIKIGNSVFIPDFGFYKNGLKHYLEIVGFWTPEYLEKKIAKLKKANISITIAVDKDLNCRKEDFSGDVLFYHKKIPILPIIKTLQELEKKQIERQQKNIEDIKVSEDVIKIEDLAREFQVNPRVIKNLNIPGYIIIGDRIVSDDFLSKLKDEIKEYTDYNRVEEILKNYDLPIRTLDYIGYKIVWNGLKPTSVIKK